MPTETETIDIYCERLDPSFWAEPINAVTNLAFIAVGVWALRGSSQTGKVLGLLTVLVGIGSLAFHTFASPWAAALDVGFIALFIIALAYLAPRHLWNQTPRMSIVASVLVIVVIATVSSLALSLEALFNYFPPGLYVGAWLSLAIYAVISLRGDSVNSGRWLALAAVIFPISLLARELDTPLCESIPIGTHWLWHLLNAIVLGLCAWAFHARKRDLSEKNIDHATP
jgi:hypothetical protein